MKNVRKVATDLELQEVLNIYEKGGKLGIAFSNGIELGLVDTILNSECHSLCIKEVDDIYIKKGFFIKDSIYLSVKEDDIIVVDRVDKSDECLAYVHPFVGKYEDYSLCFGLYADGKIADSVYIVEE